VELVTIEMVVDIVLVALMRLKTDVKTLDVIALAMSREEDADAAS
jgi:hypothetical protein